MFVGAGGTCAGDWLSEVESGVLAAGSCGPGAVGTSRFPWLAVGAVLEHGALPGTAVGVPPEAFNVLATGEAFTPPIVELTDPTATGDAVECVVAVFPNERGNDDGGGGDADATAAPAVAGAGEFFAGEVAEVPNVKEGDAAAVFEGEAVAVPTAKGDVAAGGATAAAAGEFFAGEVAEEHIAKEGAAAAFVAVFEGEAVAVPTAKGDVAAGGATAAAAGEFFA